MSDRQTSTFARISAETSASAHLYEACHWVNERQASQVRLGVDDLPALGSRTTLILGRPITAARAVICALWILEDAVGGACLLAGRIRFLAHPRDPGIRLSFSGRAATPTRSGLQLGEADHAARQLVEMIARSLGRGRSNGPAFKASRSPKVGISAAPGIELHWLLDTS
jgi:hypothetical protein